ncbi:BlaI/MecI/CopY family transcriptional regulator [Georgenia satyanarayanai]|uniref:BlaI/MecI/CopY family transcriptional regulator n=1 Tax=Georgenia satyanarayanai TaxID=860221 RepID=UPI00203CA570|nr:BlaI/MecI/CopY family transcriptional regulator [Georgenia satyanarayanai]MCM3661373.1 BlaI/MecI/CopY family transcriptional regulator [Georgenia satyanarayanai]
MPDGVPSLGPLERHVMEILWECPDDLSTRDVLERTGQPLAYTTIATVLTNLTRKGLAEKIAVGRSWAYRPLLGRSEYTAGLMTQTLATSGDRHSSLLHFLGSMSEDDVAVLRSLLTDDGATT